MTKIVIIGGGHAAAQAITSLRQKKFEGDVTLVSDESLVPYQRPPLSKAYLAGELAAGRLPILRQTAYENAGVTLKLGTRAETIDRNKKCVHLAGGETVDYDKLMIATGGRARKLSCPGAELAGVHYVRTIADTDALKPEFGAAGRILIIGGGYIGLEIASVARKLGKDVTVLEAESRILARVVAPEVSAFYRGLHEEEGVTIHTEHMVTAIEGESRVEGVLTASGERYAADLVIVGIGLIANSDLAADARLETAPMGITVNHFTQTSDPDIYAVGDVSWHRNAFYGRELRLESVQNAVDQAKTAIGHMLGENETYDSLPWFWSDQYGLKLQIAGLSTGYDELVMRGDPEARSVAYFYLKDGMMIAADCVGRIAEFMNAKKLIAARVPVSDAQLTSTRPFTEIAAELLN